MTNEHETALHEKLCAYILGEASAEERAEVEQALANSSELRAERERLEATIGLVRGAMSNGEALSPEATADVLSAAGVRKPRPWYFSTPMRIAAGIAAATLLYAVYRQRTHEPLPERMAHLDSPTLRARDGRADSSEMSFGKEAKAEEPQAESARAAGEKLAAATPPASTPPAATPSATGLVTTPATTEDELDVIRKFRSNYVGAARSDEDARVLVTTVLNQPATQPSGFPNPTAGARSENSVTDGNAQHRGATAVDNKAATAPAKSELYFADESGSASPGAPRTLPSVGGLEPYTWKVEPNARPAGPATAGGQASAVGVGGRGDSTSSSATHRFAGSRSKDSSSLAPAAPPAAAAPAESARVATVTGAEFHEAEPTDEVARRLRALGYVDGESGDDDGAIMTGGDDYFLGVRKQDSADAAELLAKLKKYPPEHTRYCEIVDQLSRRNLTPEQRQQFVDEQCRLILERCYRRPNERPRDMYFRFWGDNAFQLAALEAQSTFSVDVDTASYALARRYLNEGHLPEKSQIRTEEFINYFKPDVAAPREGTFAIQTELAPSRFSNDAGRTLLRVAVRGRDVTKQERKPLALTFVIDCSGSMKEQNRLEMVKHAIRLLVNQLDANDSIAIVTFSADARMVLPMTSASRRDLIESALYPLQPDRSTNSEAGLRMGYEAALAGLNANANNRVVFLSDGVANVGETNPEKLAEGVKRIREKGIYLNSIGVGMNNHNDTLLEQLADKGDGVCNYIDSLDEAKRVMVDNFTGAMETIARDVKIQVELDPAQVYRYRLLGYENRFIANQDFRNDKIDAGEVGAGHQVCALYELELASKPAQDAAPKPLAVVRLRWKSPRDVRRPDASEEAAEIEKAVLAREMTSYEGASFGYKRAVLAAQFAEFLRRSTHARGRSFDDLLAEAKKLEKQAEDKDFSELVTLLEKSRSLVLASLPPCDELCQAIDVVRRNQILRAEHDLLALERDQKSLEDLAKQNAELEARIRELLRRKLEQKVK